MGYSDATTIRLRDGSLVRIEIGTQEADDATVVTHCTAAHHDAKGNWLRDMTLIEARMLVAADRAPSFTASSPLFVAFKAEGSDEWVNIPGVRSVEIT